MKWHWKFPAIRRAAFASLKRDVFQTMGLAYYYVFVGPRGKGRPRTDESWNAQYLSGHWDLFDSIDELPRYAIISSYIRRHRKSPSVLDVGCGSGRLLDELQPGSFGHYVGIDVSSEAINKAQSRDCADASFVVSNVDTWSAERKFDIIVFNDVLYYLTNPVGALQRYYEMLSPGGLVIVAMFRHRNTMVIWRDIARRFAIADSIEVRNRKGELTDVRVCVKR